MEPVAASDEPTPKRQKIEDAPDSFSPLPDDFFDESGEDVPDAQDSDDDSSEEFEAYGRSVEESGGFDVIDVPSKVTFSTIFRIAESELQKDFHKYKQLALFAIDENNNEKGTNYQFVELEKVNMVLVAGIIYYCTFKVKNIGDAEQKIHKCRACVFEALDNKLHLEKFFLDDHQAEISKQEGKEA